MTEKKAETSEKTVEFLVENETQNTPEKLVTDEAPGRYVILNEIARGGAGRILLAADRHIGRKIAMKELLLDLKKKRGEDIPEDYETATIRNRFLREARVTAQLEHPSIVPVHEIGTHPDGSFYYTMQLINGSTLTKAIMKCSSLKERLELLPHFYNVCNAVAYAHSKGIINRDIKPSNVMIGEFGETVVLDWGLAKVKNEGEVLFVHPENEDVGQTVAGYAIGTPSYMPPEQAEGKIGAIDETSDIYSLGAILYQILTGKTPFSGKTSDEIIYKVLNEEPESAVKIDRAIPPELAAIAAKALAKKKEDRYGSVPELIDDLNSFMSGGNVKVYHYSLFEKLGHFAAKNKAAFVAAIVILAVFITAAAMITISLGREIDAEHAARHDKVMALYRTAQAFSEKSNKLDSEKNYMASRIYAAAAMYFNPANRKSQEYSSEFRKEFTNSEDLLADAASKFYVRDFHRGAVFERDSVLGCRITTLRASHDQKRLAAGCSDGRIIVMNYSDLVITSKFSAPGNVENILWGEDDRNLFISMLSGRSMVIDMVRKREITDPKLIPAAPADPLEKYSDVIGQIQSLSGSDKILTTALSADRETIIAGTESGRIKLFSAKSGETVKSAAFQSSPITSISFSDDGTLFITSSKEGKTVVWDTANVSPLFVIEGHSSSVTSAFFADQSDHIVTAGEDGLVRIWKRHGKNRTSHYDFDDNITAAAVTKNLSAAALSRGNKISMISKEGRQLFNKTGDFPIADLAADSDGNIIAAAETNGRIKIYDIKTGNIAGIFDTDTKEISAVTFSPDGQFLASSSTDGPIKLFSLSEMTQKTLSCKEGSRTVRFSPDNKKAAAICGNSIILFSIPEMAFEKTVRMEGRTPVSAEFLPDSKSLIAGFDNNRASIINTEENSVIDLNGKFDITKKIAVSPDGRFAATIAKNQTVKLWNLKEYKLLLTIATEKEPGCILFTLKENSLGICDGSQLKLYPMQAPDLELPPEELLRKTEREAGMELRDFYLETMTSEEISKKNIQ